MKIKDALSICLISFFSATLVVLIARSLDSQAANRLEPHLLRMADQLESLRAAGGFSTVAAENRSPAVADDGLVVHYFYGGTRCVTCEAIESQTEAALQEHFKSQLAAGELAWKTSNYEAPENAELASRFEIIMPVVVVTRYVDGQLQDWKRLDEVWGLVGDKSEFSQLIRDNVERMLAQVDDRSEDADSPVDSEAMIPLSDSSFADGPSVKPDRVIAMYFHRTERCPTCKMMGSYSEEAIEQGFPKQRKEGSVEFRMIDYEAKENAALAKAYKVMGPALIVSKITDNKVGKFQDLEQIWTKVRDKPKFIEYVQRNVNAYMK